MYILYCTVYKYVTALGILWFCLYPFTRTVQYVSVWYCLYPLYSGSTVLYVSVWYCLYRRCGGSLVALQTTEAMVPGSNPASLRVENSEARQSHCVHCKILGQRGRPPPEAKKKKRYCLYPLRSVSAVCVSVILFVSPIRSVSAVCIPFDIVCIPYQSWARDNTAATMFSGHAHSCWLLHYYYILVVHLETQTLTYLEIILVPEAQLRWRCRAIKKIVASPATSLIYSDSTVSPVILLPLMCAGSPPLLHLQYSKNIILKNLPPSSPQL